MTEKRTWGVKCRKKPTAPYFKADEGYLLATPDGNFWMGTYEEASEKARTFNTLYPDHIHYAKYL